MTSMKYAVLATVASTGFLFAAAASAQTTVVTFDNGGEGWDGNGSIEETGGNPGANAHFFIENKNSNLLSSTHGRCRVLQNKDGFPDASWADDDCARSPIHTAPQEQIDFGYAAFHGVARVIPSMF